MSPVLPPASSVGVLVDPLLPLPSAEPLEVLPVDGAVVEPLVPLLEFELLPVPLPVLLEPLFPVLVEPLLGCCVC